MEIYYGIWRKTISFSEPIWVGVAPDGILLIDRLENKIISLDYRLIYMNEISLEPRLYLMLLSLRGKFLIITLIVNFNHEVLESFNLWLESGPLFRSAFLKFLQFWRFFLEFNL